MFLRKLDFLSPPITLYYKGDKSHSSIFSGILTIIVYSICLTFAVYYAIQFVNKANPQVCYYNRYVEDAGEFPVNSSSMFNFIQILDTVKNVPEIVDFDLLNIVGLEETVDIYQDDNDLTKINHWLYGPCNNSTDIEGISELINFPHFTESACIRKYYDKNTQQYYNTKEKQFRWPEILHGCSHPNRTFYGIVIEKCRNTSLKFLSDGRYCKSPQEILDYIKIRSLNFLLIDQFTDILNYTTPYRKYFYSISNGLFEGSYTTNHLNLNPSKLISDEGKFMATKKETLSYFFELNEKVTSASGDSGIYVAFYFWMQNRMQYYERVYEKVQDVLSDVGGLCSIVLTIAELINNIVNQYINLFDSQNYLNEVEDSQQYDKNIFRFKKRTRSLRIKLKKNFDNNFFPPKKIYDLEQNNNDSSNKSRLNDNDGIDIYDKELKRVKIIKKKKIKKKNHSFHLNDNSLNKNKLLINVNNILNNNEDKSRKTGHSLSFKNSGKIEDSQSNSNVNMNPNNNKINSLNKDKNIIDTHESKASNNVKSPKLTIKFHHYLGYLFSFEKCHPYIQFVDDFRIKMISEENIILTKLNLDKLQNKNCQDNSANKQNLENNQNLDYNQNLVYNQNLNYNQN